jgi:hypothetical protein
MEDDDTTTTQQQRQQELLWQQITEQTLTKLLTTAYAGTLLFLSLTIQIHWIGGNMFRESNNNENQQPSSAQHHQQQAAILTKSHEYFCQQGLPLLIDTIRRAVSTTIDWKATQLLTQQEIDIALQQIHQVLLYGTNNNNSPSTTKKKQYPRNWIRFLLPAEEEYMDDLWDIASSPIWQDAQHQLLETVLRRLRDGDDEDGWGTPFRIMAAAAAAAEEEASSTTATTTTATAIVVLPLAKLVASFKQASKKLLSFDNNNNKEESIPSCWQQLPTVLELGDVSFSNN